MSSTPRQTPRIVTRPPNRLPTAGPVRPAAPWHCRGRPGHPPRPRPARTSAARRDAGPEGSCPLMTWVLVIRACPEPCRHVSYGKPGSVPYYATAISPEKYEYTCHHYTRSGHPHRRSRQPDNPFLRAYRGGHRQMTARLPRLIRAFRPYPYS